MDVKMQELLLLDIAAQCVRLAVTLVDVYSKLGFGSYGAWWYNISRELACYCAGLMASTNVQNRPVHRRKHVATGPSL
jgi:hypothetical protein